MRRPSRPSSTSISSLPKRFQADVDDPARQRCRAERGKHSSIARIRPGAPSEMTSSGSDKPRRRMSWKNSRQLAVSSLLPGARGVRSQAIYKHSKV